VLSPNPKSKIQNPETGPPNKKGRAWIIDPDTAPTKARFTAFAVPYFDAQLIAVLHLDLPKLILSQVVELYKVEKFLALGEAARIRLCLAHPPFPTWSRDSKQRFRLHPSPWRAVLAAGRLECVRQRK
jgi:hypothetical protein